MLMLRREMKTEGDEAEEEQLSSQEEGLLPRVLSPLHVIMS